MNLKELRESKGLSQIDLGERTGLNQSTISLYENGVRKPSLSNAKKISSVLDVSLDIFFETIYFDMK